MTGNTENQRVRKGTVEQCRSIDIRKWQRRNLLKAKRFGLEYRGPNGQVIFNMEVRLKEESMMLIYPAAGRIKEAEIYFEQTEVGYGKRKWFLCPGCGERLAILYLKDNIFCCRDCHGLNYLSSQHGNDLDYYHWQLEKICMQLKAEYDPMAMFAPEKPQGMHWKRYGRLYKKYEELAEKRTKAFLAMASKCFK